MVNIVVSAKISMVSVIDALINHDGVNGESITVIVPAGYLPYSKLLA